MDASKMADTLSSSNNAVAVVVGQCMHALLSASPQPTSSAPIILTFGNRTMALGRTRMAAMTGRNAFVYVKGKLGLLNATTPLYLQACFKPLDAYDEDEKYVELDLEAWEELVPYILKLRVMT